MEQGDNWKVKILVAGAAIGALTGLFGAYLLIQQSEKRNETPQLSAGEGVKLGMGVMTLLRMVSDLGKK